MNERIKELAEQSGYSKDFLEIGLPSNMEKFAELIVRECAKSADEWYQSHNDIHWDPAQHIKNHFGVD